MVQYQSMYRKWRPQLFEDIVGQKHITRTLMNAIKLNRIGHAYIFSGPRGVGKTTTARILAKALNCQEGPTDHPCNKCSQCIRINSGQSLDVIEIDGASNRGIDEIRELRSKIGFAPAEGKYKVYIIDEVHMLTTNAFNAFLKTLEEPPKHAIFILATTEKHKIIPTILSRCQIFDFTRIDVDDIAGYLGYVAKNEGVTAEKEALNIIARKVDGAMRDALSIFDQIVSFSGKNLTYQDVITNLNILDYDYYFRLIDYFLSNEVSGTLLIFNEILNKGFDGHHFINGLSDHLRNLLVCKDRATVQLLEVAGEVKDRYELQAASSDNDFLLNALEISNNCDMQYKNTQNKRLLIELALMKMAQLTKKKT